MYQIIEFFRGQENPTISLEITVRKQRLSSPRAACWYGYGEITLGAHGVFVFRCPDY